MKSQLTTFLLLASVGVVFAAPRQQQQQQQQQQGQPMAAPTPMSSSKFIATLNGELFRSLVIDPTVPVAVAFTMSKGCKSCTKFMDNYETVAEALGGDGDGGPGYAHFTVMDAVPEEGKGLMEMFGIRSAPAMLLFNPELLPVQGQAEGSYMKQPVVYQGSTNNAHTMTKWIMEGIASHQITRLEDLQDTEDLLAKYAMNDMAKVILFTEGDQVTSPIFKAASHIQRYAALFGVLNVSQSPDAQEVADTYKVTSFPTVVSVRGSDVETLVHSKANPITLAKLAEFVEHVALTEEQRRQIQQVMMQDEIESRKKAAEDAKKVKALPPIVITNEKDWLKKCLKRLKGYCVAVFVEDVNSESDMELLTETSKKLAQRSSFHSQVVIMDGQANYDIAEYFQANNGYPSVIYINPTKKGFHNLIGSYNPKAMSTFFVDKATAKKGKAYEPKKVPKFQETPEPVEDDGAISDDEA